MAVEWDKEHAAGDSYYRHLEALSEAAGESRPAGPLDDEKAQAEHRKLMQWYFHERERQADNRLEMALDADFYDGLQWDDDDAQVLKDRGQMPLVYNEVAPMVDFVVGTQRRSQVDWMVVPRAEDDVEPAGVKREVLKFVADNNKVPFHRSAAFESAVKVGIGWLDDGARDDPTQDVLYSRAEDWRNVLWDSFGQSLDGSDWRYIFRWRWIDEDVALAMFPQRKAAIRRAVEDRGPYEGEENDDLYYLNERLNDGRGLAMGSASIEGAKRRRVRIIECQYRTPAPVKIITSGPMAGLYLSDHDALLQRMVEQQRADIVERVAMRVHVAIMTEGDLLAMGPSLYRHNNFSLTPVWAYRRERDRLPYGIVRRVRDIQLDINKRASKALFLLNTNQIIMDTGAVEDVNVARDEVDRPDGVIEKHQNKQFEIRRDMEQANGQLQMMGLGSQKIQTAGGVTDEALGRTTNAVSGKAIESRQNQSAVVLTKVFDNLRLAIQCSGEKQLSLIEQFYTDEKIVRITGNKGNFEFKRINQPEMQPDGSVRFINDITASRADFMVDEADYTASVRRSMFDMIGQMAQRLDPQSAIRLMIIATEFSDLPNKAQIASEIRKALGERDPDQPMTQEEQQAAQAQMQMQTEALQIQRETALAALEEQRAKVREINAKAAKLEAEMQGDQLAGEGARSAMQGADRVLSDMALRLQKAELQLANKAADIKSREDIAQMEADVRLRIAEISNESGGRLNALAERLSRFEQAIRAGNAAMRGSVTDTSPRSES